VVEAAIHSGATDELEPFVATAEREAEESGSVRATIVARRARALLSDGEAFKTALETDRAEEWPFERARVELNYGEWLRRGRRIKDARTVLRSALDTFDRIGATPWAVKARIELRAAGVPLGVRPTHLLDELTPQQLQIAQLAARGFTNREIAAKVFLSPKTVAFHLYNVYPKLQITTRSQLLRALEETGQLEAVNLAG
jgi:DNA-binding CsgD family transcriptional regulator